jgi:hypothetical protein
MSPVYRDPTVRRFFVSIRDPYFERLYEWAREARMEPKVLASVLIERAMRRRKPKTHPQQAA